MIAILVLLAVAVLIASRFVGSRGSQPTYEFNWQRNSARRIDSLKWIAVVMLVPAGPLLLFGLAWGVPGLLGLGLAFVAAAALVWRVLAGEWPVARVRQRVRGG